MPLECPCNISADVRRRSPPTALMVGHILARDQDLVRGDELFLVDVEKVLIERSRSGSLVRLR